MYRLLQMFMRRTIIQNIQVDASVIPIHLSTHIMTVSPARFPKKMRFFIAPYSQTVYAIAEKAGHRLIKWRHVTDHDLRSQAADIIKMTVL